MTYTEPVPNQTQNVEYMEELIEERVSQARKEGVLDIYEDLLKTIWNRIQPTLGWVTVVAIMERTLLITHKKYPAIQYLKVDDTGPDFSELRAHLHEIEREDLGTALKEVVARMIDILTILTGDILVQKLIKEIEGRNREHAPTK